MEPNACWILCTPRTGSSFLCELLNNSNLFPPFDHSGVVNRRGPIEAGLSFGEWARLYYSPAEFVANPPPYSKMIFHQYIEAFGCISKPQRYSVGWYHETHDDQLMKDISIQYGSNFISKIFPDIKYIHLTRDTLDHAVSLYIARMTKKYHIYSKSDLDSYMNMNIEVKIEKLIKAYNDALEYKNSWQWFFQGGEKILEIEYANLINDTSKELDNIGEFLNLEFNTNAILTKTFTFNARIYRMTRPDADFVKNKLKTVINSNKMI